MPKKPKHRTITKPTPEGVIDLVDVIRDKCFGGVSRGDDISRALLTFGAMDLTSIEWQPNLTNNPGGWFTFGEVEYAFMANETGQLECYFISIKPLSSKVHYLYDNKFFYTDTRGIRCGQKYSKTMSILRNLGFSPALYRYSRGAFISYLLNENVIVEFGFNDVDDVDAPDEESTFLGFWITNEARQGTAGER